ncbi:unnamed protein product [Lactuca saligna]|uniref:Uncharacterized protein n=1 Tax=Lactuca saligna TaxID=75948 RepID=A0AA35YQ39_LACSI|nr:unnamed protein product [Lactuca saligna]
MLGVVQGWKCPPQMVDFISSLGWGANNESFGKVDFTSSKYTILSYMLPIMPGKSLYNTVRELVENALDSAESIGELPLVEITIWRDVKMRAFDDVNHQTYVDLKIFKSFSEFFVGTWWYRIQEWSYFILKELLYADPFDVEAQKKMRNNNIEAIMDRRWCLS